MLRVCACDVAARIFASRLLCRAGPGLCEGQWGVAGLQYALYGSSTAEARDLRAEIWQLKPRSLAHERPTDRPTKVTEQSLWARALLRLGGFYNKESRHLRAAKCLYESVIEQALDNRFQQGVNIGPTFAHRYALLCIHIWFLLVRLRAEGEEGKDIAQMIYENFQEDVEGMVRREGVVVRLGKHLKELEQMFYGSCLAYEKGLAGETDLTEAVLKNVYANDATHKSDAAALTRYMRRELACLSMTDSSAVLDGQIKFTREFLREGSMGDHLATG